MIDGSHPTAEQIRLYRQRGLPRHELAAVAQHVRRCDRCQSEAGTPDRIVTLSADHDGHLSYEEMERWVDREGDSDERELVETHIEHCAICRQEVADLVRSRHSLSASRWSHLYWSAAAVALIAIVGAAFFLTPRGSVTTSPPLPPSASTAVPPNETLPPPLQARVDEVLRSGKLRLPEVVASLKSPAGPQRAEGATPQMFAVLQPVGTVVLDAQPTLRWSALDGAVSYIVVIGDVETGAPVDRASIEGTEWTPRAPLQRGKTYSWQVRARRDGEVVIAPHPPAPEALFRIASDADVAALSTWRNASRRSPLSAGILLAEAGVLDESEHELRRALDGGDVRASALLAQVQSWRATSTAERP